MFSTSFRTELNLIDDNNDLCTPVTVEVTGDVDHNQEVSDIKIDSIINGYGEEVGLNQLTLNDMSQIMIEAKENLQEKFSEDYDDFYNDDYSKEELDEMAE